MLFTFSMQTVVGNFAGAPFVSLDQIIVIRLILFAAACVAFGYWARIRLDAARNQAGIAFAIGVMASLWITTRIHDLGMPTSRGDWLFTLCLLVATWAFLFGGVLFASRQTREREDASEPK